MNKVYSIVTDRIVGLLQQGVIPWENPFLNGTDAPKGYEMGRGETYKGINRILLQKPGEYLTKNQVEKYGGTIVNPDDFDIVTWFRPARVNRHGEDVDGAEVEEAEVSSEEGFVRPAFRYYKVYHISNVEGVKSRLAPRNVDEMHPSAEAEEIIRAYCQRSGMDIATDTVAGRPRYDADSDTAYLPEQACFVNDESYYSALFHQAVYSAARHTGLLHDGADEADRALIRLVAEMGSAMLMSRCGLNGKKVMRNSVALIQQTLADLKADCCLVVMAARYAEKAVGYVLNEQAEGE